MSTASTEGRLYLVQRKDIDGERFIEIAVVSAGVKLVTRDHLTIDAARSFAAEMVLAVEG